MSNSHSPARPHAPRLAAALLTPSTSATIRSAVAADLAFIVMLQKAHAAALGFLPRLALEEKIGLKQVLLARVGGSRAGFLHHGSLRQPEVRVFQIAVTTGSRCRGAGRALVQSLLERAAAAGAAGVSLRCLAFLEANGFWRAGGFRLHATEPGAKGMLNVWVRRLRQDTPTRTQAGGRFTFASRVHACPGCGRPTVDTWIRGARRLAFCANCVVAAGTN